MNLPFAGWSDERTKAEIDAMLLEMKQLNAQIEHDRQQAQRTRAHQQATMQKVREILDSIHNAR